MEQPDELDGMETAARQLAKPEAGARIADLVVELATAS
jgi:hypothetical protein